MNLQKGETSVRPSAIKRFASSLIREYISRFPVAKGKWFLQTKIGVTFLVAQLDSGPWIRVSGVSGFEWAAFFKLSKELKSRDLVLGFLKSGMTFFDIGANIGYFTLTASPRVGNGAVHAFEPTPVLAERIRLNTKLNGFHNITVCEAAVSHFDGEMQLHICQDDSEGNSLVLFESDWPSISVNTIQLDSYIEKHPIESIDLIKIDCEGAELFVLQGASRLLARNDSPVIMVEINPSTLKAADIKTIDIFNYLRLFHYQIFLIEELKSGENPVNNMLAVRESHLTKYPILTNYCLNQFSISEDT